MPRHFVHYHRVSVREGIDTETYLPFMRTDIKSETSKTCKHCCILFYIKKNFKKHDSICDICYDMLDDDRDSGGLHIVWTENQQFRIFTNIYQYSAQRLMQIEQPKNIAGFLDLRHKHKVNTPFDFDIKENLQVTMCL